jgi:hypothetical protein
MDASQVHFASQAAGAGASEAPSADVGASQAAGAAAGDGVAGLPVGPPLRCDRTRPSPEGYDFLHYPLDDAALQRLLPVLRPRVVYARYAEFTARTHQHSEGKALRLAETEIRLHTTTPEFWVAVPLKGKCWNVYMKVKSAHGSDMYDVELELESDTEASWEVDDVGMGAYIHPEFNRVKSMGCSCVIHLSEECWHVYYAAYVITCLPRSLVEGPLREHVWESPTSKLCMWNNPSLSSYQALAGLSAANLMSGRFPLFAARSNSVNEPKMNMQRPGIAAAGGRGAVSAFPIRAAPPSADLLAKRKKLHEKMAGALSRSVTSGDVSAFALWLLTPEEMASRADALYSAGVRRTKKIARTAEKHLFTRSAKRTMSKISRSSKLKWEHPVRLKKDMEGGAGN